MSGASYPGFREISSTLKNKTRWQGKSVATRSLKHCLRGILIYVECKNIVGQMGWYPIKLASYRIKFKNLRKSILNINVVHSVECFQQHKFLVSDFVGKDKKSEKLEILTSPLHHDPAIAMQFCIIFNTRVLSLKNINVDGVEEAWTMLKQSLLETTT